MGKKVDIQGTRLYEIKKDVKCVECGNIGAVMSYGEFYENGLGDKIDEYGPIVKPIMEKNRNIPYMNHACGFGGTIPYECLNCGNVGLIDMGGLECYDMAFETIKKEKKDEEIT